MALTIITQPTVEPVTRTNMKDFLRVDSSDTSSDTLIDRLVTAARSAVEGFLRRALITQTWDLVLDDIDPDAQPLRMISDLRRWDGPFSSGPILNFGTVQTEPIPIPLGKLQSITGVFVTDDSGVETTVDATTYFTNTTTDPGRLILTPGNDWPSHRTYAGFRVRFVAGYGNADTNVPIAIQTGIMQTVAWWFEHRDEQGAVPEVAKSVLSQYRLLDIRSTWRGRVA